MIGRDFTTATLAALTEAAPPAVAGALAPAEASNAILATEPGAFRFSHVLVGETLYQDLPPARRQALHLQLAGLLEARGGDVLAEIAHHLLAALPAGDAGVAVAAARQAADRAMAMLAFEDAAAMLETARGALQKADRLDARENLELRLRAGLAFLRAGQGDRGRALCAAAADEARRMGDGAGLARAALGYGAELMLAQTDPTLIELLSEALAKLPPGPSGIRAQVMARLASAQMPAADPDPPMQMARDAVAMARQVGADDDVLRATLYFAGSALADYGEPAERAAISEELVARARLAHDRVQILRGECRLVFDYLELGNVEKSARAADAYEAIAVEFRQSRHLWPARLIRAMYATAQGRRAEASQLLAEARSIAAADPESIAQAVMAWHALGQVVFFERLEEVDAAYAEFERAFRLQMPTHPHMAATMIQLGRVALLARFGDDPDEITRILEILPWEVAYLSREATNLVSMAEPIAVAGHARLAARLYPASAAASARIGSWGRSGFICSGPAERGVALLAGTLGRLDEAIDRLERAAARAEQLGFRVMVGDTRCWQAQYLVARRQPGDAERARACLNEAEKLATAIDLRRLVMRVARVRASLQGTAPEKRPGPEAARPADRPEARAPAFTLTREGDYWTVAAGNVTTRIKHARGMQILSELVTSPGREFHVLALMGTDGEGVDAGDAGELLDKEAIAEYRERLRALEDELDEAERWSDRGRAARARAERDAIANELARGVGLGGRTRRASAAAERARVNVQRRVRGAIKTIGQSLPDLAAYLDRAVRTGTFCSYEPF